MPGVITGTSDIPVNLQGYYDRNLLESATPELVYGMFGQLRPVPKNSGTRINMRRYGALAVAGQLVEGMTPTGKKAQATTIYATLVQHGDFITRPDWIIDTGLDDSLLQDGKLLGEQAGLTIDTYDRDVLCAGATVRYANDVTAARSNVVTALSLTDLESAIRTLEANNAKKIKSMIKAGSSISTYPIREAYIGLGHSHVRYDIERLAGFISVEEYASTKDMLPGEIGSVKNVRFLLTSNGKIWPDEGGSLGTTGLISTSGSNIDVYGTLIVGANAYATVPLQRENIKNIIHKLGSAGTEDPLDQRATTGWKSAHTCKILNDDFMVRIEHGVTDI